MNEELTNEVLEAMERCGEDIGDQCRGCPAKRICHAFDALVRIKFLATALLDEKAKPKVWDGAPDDAVEVCKEWRAKDSVYLSTSKSYFRELQKTRARQIAENIVHGMSPSAAVDIEYVEGVLNKYAEELTKKETD